VTERRVVADLGVIGGGLIGLATTAAAAERGLSVALLASDRPGAASRAGAGLLVPHYGGEGVRGEVARFMAAGRDQYPAYVQWIQERAGVPIPFQQSGALELARSPEECTALNAVAPADAVRFTADDVAELEPALAPTAGGLLYPRDGAVDNARLTDALSSIVEHHSRVRIVREAALRIDLASGGLAVIGVSGTRVQPSRIVLAAGAWSNAIHGLPRPLPIRPLRGQICTVGTTPLRHVVLGPDVYLVSRNGDRTLIGSTMEEAGFDAATTPSAVDGLRRGAVAMCPQLAEQRVIEAWSGLRPATPDLLPILGVDPDDDRLVYACGHSRNGILLAPLTAAVTAAIVAGDDPTWDLSPFSIERFGRTPAAE
jgi:glycine oxidase